MIYCEKFRLVIVSKDYNDVSFDSNLPFLPNIYPRSDDMTHRQYKLALCLTYIAILISLLLLAIQTASLA
jgi:hypothetical protein